jgi:hypothetical protein
MWISCRLRCAARLWRPGRGSDSRIMRRAATPRRSKPVRRSSRARNDVARMDRLDDSHASGVTSIQDVADAPVASHVSAGSSPVSPRMDGTAAVTPGGVAPSIARNALSAILVIGRRRPGSAPGPRPPVSWAAASALKHGCVRASLGVWCGRDRGRHRGPARRTGRLVACVIEEDQMLDRADEPCL